MRVFSILNQDSEDLGSLACGKKTTYYGFCTSVKCCTYEYNKKLVDGTYRPSKKIRDKVFRTQDEDIHQCSQCGTKLIWFKPRSGRKHICEEKKDSW